MNSLAIPCFALLAATSLAQDGKVTWRGELVPPDTIAMQAPAAAATARAWLPFTDPRGYRLVLSEDARVLLVLGPPYARKDRKGDHHEVTKMLGLVRETTAAVEALFGLAGKDEGPGVVAATRKADYEDLLGHIGKLDPRLAKWADAAGLAVTGFILSEPLAAAWIEDASGLEEWHHHNELVHRTAQLLVRRRADQLPAWFALGFGWHVEETVRKSIYCFPHRSGFVWATEHTGWGQLLANRFNKKVKPPPVLAIDEVAGWEPAKNEAAFDTEKAGLAFGIARYLAREHAGKVLALAQSFDAEIEKHWKVWISKDEWRTNPDYRIPATRQLELLQAVEADFLAKATEYFKKRMAAEAHGRGRK